MNNVGTNIRILRQQRRWSQEKLALSAGVDVSYLGQIERMQRSPTVGILERIANALEVECSTLLPDTRIVCERNFKDANPNDISRCIAMELKNASLLEKIVYYKLLKLIRESYILK